jgi:DNA-binding PadR family transcriptional regulator
MPLVDLNPNRGSAMPPPNTLSPTLLHILLTLADGVRHGYAIKRDIERRTDGALRLGPATLYVSIQRLERDGLIINTSQPIEQPDPRPNRRYYRLTEHGLATLRQELDALEQFVAYGRSRPGLSGEPS